MMYVSGTKSANSRRKTPRTVIAKARRARMRMSGLALALGEEGRRSLMKMLAKRQRTREMAAMTLMDYAKPILGIRSWRMRGKRIPPKAPPVVARPVALPRRLLK